MTAAVATDSEKALLPFCFTAAAAAAAANVPKPAASYLSIILFPLLVKAILTAAATAIAVTAVINLVEGGRREEEVCL